MKKIKLTNDSMICPPGWHTFKITKVDYKEGLGNVKITLKTKEGYPLIEEYILSNESGYSEDNSMNFLNFAKICLNDFTIVHADPEELKGRYVDVNVNHLELMTKCKRNEVVNTVYSKEKRPSKVNADNTLKW